MYEEKVRKLLAASRPHSPNWACRVVRSQNGLLSRAPHLQRHRRPRRVATTSAGSAASPTHPSPTLRCSAGPAEVSTKKSAGAVARSDPELKLSALPRNPAGSACGCEIAGVQKVTLGLGSDAPLDVSYLRLDRDDGGVPSRPVAARRPRACRAVPH